LLQPHHDVVALATLGHRGGVAPSHRPVTVRDLVDQAERELDARGLERPHVAGNSLGGWMALELARRGRARTVCAISPAGSWTAGTEEQTAGVRKIRRSILLARLGRALPMNVLMRSGFVRRMVFRDVAEHGDRLTVAQALEATRDLLGCVISDDMLTLDEGIPHLAELACPVTLVWGDGDRLLPFEINGAVARRRIPSAEITIVPGAGHVPMIDEPERVAEAILRSTGTIQSDD
jgi:pimeloyl-ACP methyl ester carboxylesterase